MKEVGLGSGVLVDVGIPNPESTVVAELWISGEAEKASLVVRPRRWIAEARKRRNPCAERANFPPEIEKDGKISRAVRSEALPEEQPGLCTNEEGIVDDVDVRDEVDFLHHRPQFDIDVGGDRLGPSWRRTCQCDEGQ